MPRLTIDLTDDEFDNLVKYAQRERRTPANEAAWLVVASVPNHMPVFNSATPHISAWKPVGNGQYELKIPGVPLDNPAGEMAMTDNEYKDLVEHGRLDA